ncbi:probable UDP-3-O-acyl-N-acetylglucosamine deacetylase 2, mitochondrial isoform X1 [Tanacetum coccineum]
MFHLSDSSRNGRKTIHKKRHLLELSLLHCHRGGPLPLRLFRCCLELNATLSEFSFALLGQGYEDTKYLMKRQKQIINGLIEEALLESEAKGVKGEGLNRSGELFVRKNPQTKVKVLDGSSSELAGKGRYFYFGASFIPASIEYAKEVSPLCTTLSRDGWSVRTVEHLLSALEGTGVDNCRIEIFSSHHNDTSAEKDVTTPNKDELIRAFNDDHKAVCKALKLPVILP